MAFQKEPAIEPIDWNGVHIELYFSNVGGAQNGRIRVSVAYSDDSAKEKTFDLLARLQDDAAGQQHLANLAALKEYTIARIESEVLP